MVMINVDNAYSYAMYLTRTHTHYCIIEEADDDAVADGENDEQEET